MSQLDNSGPAFPGFQYEIGSGCCKTKDGPNEITRCEVYDSGMSLRMWLAAHVAQDDMMLPSTVGQCAERLGIPLEEYHKDPAGWWYKLLAKEKFRVADAMIAASKEDLP